MGYRISWIAVEGFESKERLLSELGLADTGQVDEANEAPFSIAQLPTGWIVLWANDEKFASPQRVGDLSRTLGSVLAVRVNETSMHSTAILFAEGKQSWRVHHEGDGQTELLEQEGKLPLQAQEIEAEFRLKHAEENAEAAAVDYLFEIPLEIAKSICGYRHDLWRLEWGEPEFTVVQPNGTC